MLSLLRRLSTWRYPLPAFAAERRRLQISIRYVFKWSSWVVPINAQKIQDGGRPPFWKPLNGHNSAIVWPIFDEIWHGDAYWLLTADRAVKFRIFWNPRRRRPPSWKSQKSRYLRNGLTDFLRSLVYWCKRRLLTAATVKKFDICRYLSQTPSFSNKPANRHCCYQSKRQTNGRPVVT